jgi:hypothetical protein
MFVINFCTTSYGSMQTSTNPRRQSRCQGCQSIPFLSHTSSLHGTAWSTPSRFLCAFLDSTYPSPSISPLSAEDDDGKLDSYVKRECGHIPYQRNVKPNEYNSSRMTIFSCGTANAHGWYVNGSNSRYVALSSVVSARQPRTAS